MYLDFFGYLNTLIQILKFEHFGNFEIEKANLKMWLNRIFCFPVSHNFIINMNFPGSLNYNGTEPRFF